MNIGTLRKNTRGVYMGTIATVTLSLTVGLRAVESNNPAAPKFDVLARNVAGQWVPIGALWEKQASNGTGAFLQGTLNDPSFAQPISIAMFLQQDDSLNVAWSRPKARTQNAFEDVMGSAASDGDDSFAPRNEDLEPSAAADTAAKAPRGRKAGTPANEGDPFANETGELVTA